MKKFLAVIVSIVFYLCMFLVGIEIMWATGVKTFFYCGFPVTTMVYFLIVGSIFNHRIQLKYLTLFLCMNFVGYPLCWTVLTILEPGVWFNLGIVFLIVPLTLILIVLWALIGLVFFCVSQYKKRQFKKMSPNSQTVDFSFLQSILQTIAIIFAIGAIYVGGISAYSYFRMKPADIYIDGGIDTFYPHTYYTTQKEYQIKINRSWQTRYRTVYIVEYLSDRNLRYSEYVGTSKTTARNTVTENVAVERRILWIDGEDNYITIPPELTAESYINQYRTKYLLLFSGSVLYLVVFGYFLFKICPKPPQEERT